MPCELVKEFLSREQIAFETIDVSTLDDPVATLREVTGGPIGTPTVVIGDEFHMGFDPDWLRQHLGLE